jgi:hypothetical protein
MFSAGCRAQCALSRGFLENRGPVTLWGGQKDSSVHRILIADPIFN